MQHANSESWFLGYLTDGSSPTIILCKPQPPSGVSSVVKGEIKKREQQYGHNYMLEHHLLMALTKGMHQA